MPLPQRVLVFLFAVCASLGLAACGGDDDERGLDTNYPEAGEDVFESTTATVEIEYEAFSVSAVPRAQALERIELEGPTTVTRGDPQDADGDGRVDVATEITELELSGTASFGDLIVRLNPDKRSTGMVEQQEAGKDTPADSFFDVFVQVELPDPNGGTNVLAVNEEPLRMQAELSDLPPGEGDEYRAGEDGEPVPLVAVNDATLRLGKIVDALHIPNPEGGEGSPTDEPEETPEPEDSPEPEEDTPAPWGAPQVSAEQRPGCEHTQPGVQSDLLDLIFVFLLSGEPLSREPGSEAPEMVLQLVSGDGRVLVGPAAGALKEPLVGATVNVSATGPGVSGGPQSAVTDEAGAARVRIPINRFGDYQLTVGSVQAPSRTLYQFGASEGRNVTFTVEEECTIPEGF